MLDVNPADSVSTSPNVLTSGITDANSHSMQELPVGGQLMVSGQTGTNAIINNRPSCTEDLFEMKAIF